MVEGIDLLEIILGKEIFLREAAIILTDRGSKFADAEGIEKIEKDNIVLKLYLIKDKK